MMICLAGLEGCKDLLADVDDKYLKYGLISFYYLKNQEILDNILKKVDYLLIDSGAHSFQHGKKVDFDEYTRKYAEFIKKNTDNPQILGFFEMDVDNVIGYEKVLELRKQLTNVSNKIIPVWHNNRGIKDFQDMCKEYSGRRIAITGFANNDITDGQYNLFINYAHQQGCNIHILGLTRFELIKDLNLKVNDSVDSSTWLQASVFNEVNLPIHSEITTRFKLLRGLDFKRNLLRLNFLTARYMQLQYKDKDQSIY